MNKYSWKISKEEFDNLFIGKQGNNQYMKPFAIIGYVRNIALFIMFIAMIFLCFYGHSHVLDIEIDLHGAIDKMKKEAEMEKDFGYEAWSEREMIKIEKEMDKHECAWQRNDYMEK